MSWGPWGASESGGLIQGALCLGVTGGPELGALGGIRLRVGLVQGALCLGVMGGLELGALGGVRVRVGLVLGALCLGVIEGLELGALGGIRVRGSCPGSPVPRPCLSPAESTCTERAQFPSL